MYNFKEMLLLDDKTLNEKLSEIDSSFLIDYLKLCKDENIKNEYYKRIENIFGNNYYNIFKIAVKFKNKINLKKIFLKYSLFLFNIIFSSLICVLIFLIFDKTPLDYFFKGLFYEIDILLIMGFIIGILPQMVISIILHFINKLIKIKKILDIVITIIIGNILSFIVLLYSFRINVSIIEYVIYGYNFYIPFIISGILYKLVLYKVKKINVRE